jgi:hypothetical protein
MTIAFIAAAKDHFYIVSDSLCRGDEAFTLNTQKSFFSEKHRIGLCIAGEAVLKFDGISHVSEVLYADFVMKEFFEYIDSLDVCPVELLNDQFSAFFGANYPGYFEWFNQKVSYYYGGFQNAGEGTKVTAIFCHHISEGEAGASVIEDKSYVYSDEGDVDPFFANTNSVKKYLDWTLAIPGTPEDMTPKAFLTNAAHRFHVLTFTLPHACLAVNAEVPYYIGKHLRYTKMTSEAVIHRSIKYEAADSPTGLACQLDPADAPPSLSHRSYKESNRAFMNGGLVKYNVADGMPIPNESVAALKIQSVFRGCSARAKLAEAEEAAHTV